MKAVNVLRHPDVNLPDRKIRTIMGLLPEKARESWKRRPTAVAMLLTEVERAELHAACERRGMSDGEAQTLVANLEQRPCCRR